jgi:phage tail sheath protein FI
MATSDHTPAPGVHVQQTPGSSGTITGVATAITVFVGRTATGPLEPVDCFSQADFERDFGEPAAGFALGYAVGDFFRNGGSHAVILRVADLVAGDATLHTGLYALDKVDLFNLMCIPRNAADDAALAQLYKAAAVYCLKRRAMLIVDPPKAWSDAAAQGSFDRIQIADLGIDGPQLEARNCAVYFPGIKKLDPGAGQTDIFPACGAVAGIFAATDSAHGVWKAPAGIAATIGGISGLESDLTEEQNGALNLQGINCLRNFPTIGPVVWGARTLRGALILEDDYKYVPVRRLALFIEESIYRGITFAVFKPNDEALWSQLRLSINAFMADLKRQGAFYSFSVKCDSSTTTPADIGLGVVNILVMFAPVKPGEFIILQIQQQAGQAAA